MCARLKTEPATAGIPIIFLTATSTLHCKVQGLELGAVDYVTKPFEPDELRARVRGALRTKRVHDSLAARAYIDATTGLFNRRCFDERLAEQVAAAVRHGRGVSLALVDLDHFKRINDTYGHGFGDLVLEQVGRSIADNTRVADVACRFGGEELAVIMTDTWSEGAFAAALRCHDAIGALRPGHGDEIVRVTASIGVAGADQLGAVSEDGLIRLADEALYVAKRTGRNRVCLAAARAPAGTVAAS